MKNLKGIFRRAAALMLMLALVILCLMPTGCSAPHKSKTAYGYFGGTYFTLHDYSGMSESKLNSLFDKLCKRLEYYGKLFDIYYEYSDINNLRTVNLSAGGAVTVAPEIIELIELSKQMHERTGGEVNIAFGSVLSLWHAARESGDYIPDMSELTAASSHCDINDVVIDRAASTVTLLDPEMSLDVGAVAKGFAVEKLAEYAISLGATSLVIDVGGNLRTVGESPSGGGWPVYIQNPTADGGKNELLENVTGAAVTSGDYQRYYVFGGKKYHHIIDKDSLMPAEYFSSVTVVCETSGVADALSTALFCMNVEGGRELLSEIPEVMRAVWITAEGQIIRYEKQ